jgi:hypothetical protein
MNTEYLRGTVDMRSQKLHGAASTHGTNRNSSLVLHALHRLLHQVHVLAAVAQRSASRARRSVRPSALALDLRRTARYLTANEAGANNGGKHSARAPELVRLVLAEAGGEVHGHAVLVADGEEGWCW